MAMFANWRTAALVGLGIFLLHLVIYRAWPPPVADILGSALLGLVVAGVLFGLARVLGRRG